MGYKGVKFDDKGQNVLAAGLVIQLQDGENYVAGLAEGNWPRRRRCCPTRAGNDRKGRDVGPALFDFIASRSPIAQPASR